MKAKTVPSFVVQLSNWPHFYYFCLSFRKFWKFAEFLFRVRKKSQVDGILLPKMHIFERGDKRERVVKVTRDWPNFSWCPFFFSFSFSSSSSSSFFFFFFFFFVIV